MFIKRLDYLSPPITFYHQGLLFHSSFVSGIISIISIVLIIILTVYYSKELIEKKNPKYFSYNTFIEDSGIFPLNASSLFHFISISSNQDFNNNDGFDFSLFRIIGLENYYEMYLYDKDLTHYNHWLYGKCRITDYEGIGNLIQIDFFKGSACIRKYFNKDEQKYYNVEDSKFRWPVLSHGTLSGIAQLYNIIVEKCEENTINLILGENFKCKNTTEFKFIQNYTYYSEIFLFIVNYYEDISNYSYPYKTYIEMIGNNLLSNLYYVNHLNFNPSLIKTYNGLIFDKYEEKSTVIFERNDIFSFDRESKNIYSIFVMWLKNKLYKNERSYKKLQDVISSVGGIYQSITIIAAYINSLYNQFITLSDTEVLLHSFIHSEKHSHENKKKEHKNQKIQKLKEIHNNKKKNDISKALHKERYNTEKTKSKKDENDKKVNETSYINNKLFTSKENINNSSEKFNFKDDNSKFRNTGTTKKLELTNFLYYLIFLITCRKKKKYFNFYRKFRMKIISEEHLIRNHLNIYNLLRVTERKRYYKRNSYQLNDLIKLI